MNHKQKGLLRGMLIFAFIAFVGGIGYYFIYYRPNRAELIKISKEFVEKIPCLDAIPEEIREEKFDSDQVQAFIEEVRTELSKYYAENGDYLEREVEYLSEFYEDQFIEGNDMVTDMESEVYQIDKVSFSTKHATVKVKTKVREVTELYGSHTVKVLYTIEYVRENGAWKIIENENEPAME